MALPPEKVGELRQLIQTRVSELGIQDQIRGCVADTLGSQRNIDEGTLLQVLEERGVVDQVLRSLDLSEPAEDVAASHTPEEEIPPKKGLLSSNMRYLFLQVCGGKAFVEHLQETTSNTTFTLHVHFRGQRFNSRPVPCACEPNFTEGYLLELSKHDKDSRIVSYTDALSIADPIHLVLTRKNEVGDTSLVGSCYLEWRGVLSDTEGRISVSVELSGVGPEAKIPAGILEMKLEILPKLGEVLNGDIVSAQVGLEKQRGAERERLFLVYAKQWWKEYLQIRPAHSQRLVKIFAQDESGVNRPVCVFVHPLRPGRLLDSPRHAARFTSLIPFERASSVGSSRSCAEVWNTLHAMLGQKKGDCEDHAVLLCNLLLGYGLDACVCIGTKMKGLAHAWVMTVGHGGTIVFWESLTGQRFIHSEYDPNTHAGTPVPQPTHPYCTIGCVFNHRSFYANAQTSDLVSLCHFDLHNGSLWKAMSPEAIKSVTHGITPPSWGIFPPLLPAQMDPILSANEMEGELRSITAQYRRDLGLTTVWDDELCYLLTPALSAYETERCVGVTAGNEEFQEAIRNAVPEGHTFKGFPIQFVHRHSRRAFNASLKSPVCMEILGCKGDHVRLAVRVKIYCYPEDVCATWVMFAVKYRSIV